MKMLQGIGFVLGTYLVLGVLMYLLQVGLTMVAAPDCAGTVQHRIWDKYSGPSDQERLSDTATGKPSTGEGISFLARGVNAFLHWGPDFYNEVYKGPMSGKEYMLGGYTCSPKLEIAIPNPQTWGLREPGDRRPGSRAKGLLDELK